MAEGQTGPPVVAGDSGQVPKSCGVDQHSRVSRPRSVVLRGPSHPGYVINPAGPWAQPELTRSAGRPRWPSDRSARFPGLLVDPKCTRTSVQVTVETW